MTCSETVRIRRVAGRYSGRFRYPAGGATGSTTPTVEYRHAYSARSLCRTGVLRAGGI
nr:MAG TPA: hypothetical protein [Caudoviricetes sp.]